MDRKNKEVLALELDKARKLVAQLEEHEKQANASAKNAQASEKDAKKASKEAIDVLNKAILPSEDQEPAAPGSSEKLNASIQILKADPPPDPVDRLLLEAFSAREKNEIQNAFTFFAAAAILDDGNALTQFNAGVLAQRLFNSAEDGESRLHWFNVLAGYYKKAMEIDKKMHSAAYNWGNALNAQATAIARSDLPKAQELWQQAGEKYALTLSIKPDKHEAANNWGNALLRQYKKTTTPEDATALLDKAKKLLLQHVKAAPAKIAFVLACCYAQEADAVHALQWLEKDKQAGNHRLRVEFETGRFDKIRDNTSFQDWVAANAD